MAKRVIWTWAVGWVFIGAYARAWRRALAATPGTGFKHSPCSGFPAAREQVLEEFRQGLAERINRHIPGFGVGRRWSDDYWWACARLARQVNTPRLRVHVGECPRDLRDRLAHRLHDWRGE